MRKFSAQHTNERAARAPINISQNFLTSAKTINRLLSLTTIGETDSVLEIGCGKGHITRELAMRCRHVRSYELDSALCEKARARLKDLQNISLFGQDFLKASLPESEPYKVFANIPFSLTSDIIRKLTQWRNPPSEMWLVMEKGAAKRFMGKPRDTAASLLLKPFFELEIVYHLRREDFHPAPSVDTVLLHFARRSVPDVPPLQRAEYARFIEQSLKGGVSLTKKQVRVALKLSGLPQIPASGEMLYVQWLCLFRCSRQFGGKPLRSPRKI